MKQYGILSALPLVVAVACTPSPRTGAATTSEPAIEVQTARAEIADVAAPVEAGGVVRARLTASVSSRVLAPITEVRVRAGDRVRRGQPLVMLDSREVSANRARAAAALAAAEQGVSAADAERRSAESSLTLARATHTRIETLQAKRSATAQELDEATAGLAAADARVAGAQARLSEARAALDASRAAAEAATVGASYATLTAPFDGIVSERLADPGTMAAPGVPLLTVEDTSAYRLEVSLDESRAAGIRLGDPATIRIENVGDNAPIAGRVAEIARLDSSSHAFVVKIDIPAGRPADAARAEGPAAARDDRALRSGLFGYAAFAGAPRRGIAVPAKAVVPRGQLTFVYAIDADGTARLRPVSAAAPSGDRVELLAGIQPGERVVVAPPPSLTDGARVRAGATR